MFIHFPHSKCHFGAIRLYPYFRHGHVGRKPWPSEHSDLVPKEPPLRSGSQGHKARLASPRNGHLGAANHQTKWWKVMKMQNDQKLIRMSLGPLLIKLFWYGQNVDKDLDRKSSDVISKWWTRPFRAIWPTSMPWVRVHCVRCAALSLQNYIPARTAVFRILIKVG